MALEFPSEIAENGDVVRINIKIFSSSSPTEISINEIIDATVIYRRMRKQEVSTICLAHHTYQEMEFNNEKWRCCWLHGQKHQVELSILHKAR